MNETHPSEKLRRAALSSDQQHRLVGMIEAIFEMAIDARSPRNRPPGKAGLRAEKGYYRLLYLEEDFRARIDTGKHAATDAPCVDGESLDAILRQLADIPELRSEIMAGIDAALDELTVDPPPE